MWPTVKITLAPTDSNICHSTCFGYVLLWQLRFILKTEIFDSIPLIENQKVRNVKRKFQSNHGTRALNEEINWKPSKVNCHRRLDAEIKTTNDLFSPKSRKIAFILDEGKRTITVLGRKIGTRLRGWWPWSDAFRHDAASPRLHCHASLSDEDIAFLLFCSQFISKHSNKEERCIVSITF